MIPEMQHADTSPFGTDSDVLNQVSSVAGLVELAQIQASTIVRLTTPRPSVMELLPAMMPLIGHLMDLLKPAPRPEMGAAERRVMIDHEAAHAKLMIELEEARAKARAVDQFDHVAAMADDNADAAA
jgi:hypothetical protein